MCVGLASPTQARDDKKFFSISDAMASPNFQEKLGNDIKFFWGKQNPGKIERTIGEYSTSKKTNGFNKSDLEACEWALLSGLIAMADRARQAGGNAVINIVSNYKHNEFSSETEYECHNGGFVTGVAIKASVAKIK